ncbi:MAG: DUF6746 family protein, partial [Pseudomonadales bacterium]
MKSFPCLLVGLLALSLGPFGLAHATDKRPEHFKGKPAHTLEEAVNNLSEYNRKLAVILERKELGPHDLHEVHQLTYTLENALEKLHAEYATMADALEDVHVASERADAATVKAQGKVFLETSG